MGLFFESVLTDIVVVLSVIMTLIYYYLTSTFSIWESKKIPYIMPKILFGNMKDIMTFKVSQPEKFLEFHKHFRELGHSYGGLFELRKPVLLLCEPEIIKDITIKNFPSFHDRGMSYDEHNDPLTAHLLLLDGQRWKYLRSKLAPAFSTGKLKVMIRSFVDAAKPLVEIWDKGAESGLPLDMRELMAQYTTDVIGMCAFGLQLNSTVENATFRSMGRKIFLPSKKEKILQIIRNAYPWIYKTFKLRQVSEEMTDYFINVLRETMDQRKQNRVEKNDFLNYLMKIRDAKGMDLTDLDEMNGVEDYNLSVQDSAIELTEGVICAQAFIFFIAGFETTASSLSFCLYELSQHPECQVKMQEEIDVLFEKYKEINMEFLSELKYTEQVLLETLRLYPAAWLFTRMCQKPYKLPDRNTYIDPGTHVFISPYSMHRDPEYFPDPEKFDPCRFSPENREKIIPYTYLPFGEGPRVCIGRRFAMLEMKTVLAIILSKFTIVTGEKTKPVRIDPAVFVLSAIDGIWLNVVRRPGKHQDQRENNKTVNK